VITEVLGLRPGDRLTLTAGAGVVVARRDPGGAHLRPLRRMHQGAGIPVLARARATRLRPGPEAPSYSGVFQSRSQS
jgi:hypothetical protein